MKKVLFISYYFPPSGGSGVQRVLKFIKYLPQFGWQPIVYTVENGEYPVVDNSLEKDIPKDLEVLRRKIWEPYNLYKKFTGQSSESKISPGFLHENKKPKLTQRFSQWIRGNIFIPDARKFWIKPSIKFLTKYLASNPVDAIISSGPPHSVHLIALGLKIKFKLPWIADFRDPWTNVYYYSSLHLSNNSHIKNLTLEKEVLQKADAVVVVGDVMKTDFEKITDAPVHTVTNGFDEDDKPDKPILLDEKFSLVYTGYLLNDENPEVLWQVLSELVNENESFRNDLELKFIGKVDGSVLSEIKNNELNSFCDFISYQPHDEVVKYQCSAQILLLLLSDSEHFRHVLTGKMFEYLSANRPILCIGSSNGDAASIIRETNTGVTIGSNDKQTLREKLLDFYNRYKQKNLQIQSQGIEKYSRINLTKELSEILNFVTNKQHGN